MKVASHAETVGRCWRRPFPNSSYVVVGILPTSTQPRNSLSIVEMRAAATWPIDPFEEQSLGSAFTTYNTARLSLRTLDILAASTATASLYGSRESVNLA